MKTIVRCFISLIVVASFAGLPSNSAQAAKGQDFPNTTCTCKGCGSKGGDVTGQCASVCKDKTVYSKGSEPTDYCKAARVRLPKDWIHAVPSGGTKAQ
jgi:hypothetical protein